MRQIKFRGKRLDNGEWIIGYYSEFALCDGQGRCSYIKIDGCSPIKVDSTTVGQFTGLLDNNDKEIYEGDILKRVCYSAETNRKEVIYHSQVYWRTKNACWGIKNPTKTGGWSKSLDFNRIFNNAAEIIGNIHDNPELLKTK